MAEEPEPDRVCMHCGEILSGPNAGEKIEPGGAHVSLPPGETERKHKGRRLTHCGGHGCAEEMEADIQYYQDLDARRQARNASKRHRFPEMPAEQLAAKKVQSGPRVNPDLQAQLSQDKSRRSALKKLSAWEKKHSTKLPKPPKR